MDITLPRCRLLRHNRNRLGSQPAVTDLDYLFLAPVEPASLATVANDLNELLNLRFAEDPDFGFRFSMHEVALDLTDHDFDTDRDLPFQDYPFVITVRKIGWDPVFQAIYAHHLFQWLKESKRYRLLLTTGLQRVVDSYDPIKGR